MRDMNELVRWCRRQIRASRTTSSSTQQPAPLPTPSAWLGRDTIGHAPRPEPQLFAPSSPEELRAQSFRARALIQEDAIFRAIGRLYHRYGVGLERIPDLIHSSGLVVVRQPAQLHAGGLTPEWGRVEYRPSRWLTGTLSERYVLAHWWIAA
jgi:hypothetical protein